MINSVIKMLLDATVSSDEEKEVIAELVIGIEEYATDFICGLGFLEKEKKETLEKEFPKLFGLQKVV